MSTNLAGELEVLDQVMLSSRQLKYGLRKCKSKQGVTLDTWYFSLAKLNVFIFQIQNVLW